MGAGDALDGTWTAGTSAPLSKVVIVFVPAQPTDRPYIKHTCRLANSGAIGSGVLPWTPKLGNLLIAAVGWDCGGAANPTLGSGWTEFKAQTGITSKFLILAYRYVQSGDTAAIAALRQSAII